MANNINSNNLQATVAVDNINTEANVDVAYKIDETDKNNLLFNYYANLGDLTKYIFDESGFPCGRL